ncbi:MAG TPA: choice-of-anchor L domain-containing protein [Phycisphaerae bacterium]|nr:choice-of-anchor L domain-containing protein [Phycisphaerae bacterium]
MTTWKSTSRACICESRVWATRLWKPVAMILLSSLVLAPASAPPQRPRIEPGGNNRIAPAVRAPQALTTQNLNFGLTPSDLVTTLLGTGVTVSNVTFTGANIAAGTFAGGTGIVGFESGIILSSGDISFVPGPNTQDDVSGVNAGIGDVDLNGLIPGYTTFDACILEFDFECTGTQVIQFQYVFTSEEYNEWVNSPFNDVFGFFLNGVNIALVPGSAGTPVSINNVNCNNPFNPPTGSFCNLFINNDCSDIPPGTFPCAGVRDIQMDGLIVILTATGTLIPGVNHIKLAIADAGDQVLDSNVFIQGQSFTCGEPTGACCDTSTQTCVGGVPQANCQGPNMMWTVGLACNQLDPPCTATHPAGTDCANPIPITALPFVDTNTTTDKGNDYTSTCLGDYDNGLDILYELTIAATQCVDITVTGATPNDNWIGVALDSACPPGAVCMAQGTSQGNVATITNLTLGPGTYYLMIDRWPLASDGLNFTLSVADCGGAPTGACCNTATQICNDNVLAANCQGLDDVWSAGIACGDLNPPCAPEVDPVGQDCEFPIYVTSIPFEDVNTTADKKEDYAITCLGVYDDGNDIVYQITLTGAHCVDITVAGATAIDHSIGVVLDDVCPPGSTGCIAQATTTGTVATITNLLLDPGTYYLMIDRQPDKDGLAILDFRLSIADCPPPSGACCLQDGQCAQLSEADCMSANGLSWTIDVPCSPNPCPYIKGDTNCSHAVTTDDIPDFVDALIGTYTGCDITLADMNNDGNADGLDIQDFIYVLLPL